LILEKRRVYPPFLGKGSAIEESGGNGEENGAD
jgi:hypothetical protein